MAKHLIRAAMALAFIPVFTTTPGAVAQAQEHVVSPTDMQQATVDAAQSRQRNVDTLDQFFSSQKAEQALRASNIDPQQVRQAIPTLSDAELAQMTARANNAQQQFAAGNMSDHELLLILVIVAVLILVIIAVR